MRFTIHTPEPIDVDIPDDVFYGMKDRTQPERVVIPVIMKGKRIGTFIMTPYARIQDEWHFSQAFIPTEEGNGPAER